MKEMFEYQLQHNKNLMLGFFAIVALAAVQTAMAIATPQTGTLGYDLYDVAVNDMLNGPIGYVAGLAAIVFGGFQIVKSYAIAGLSVLGGSAVLNADTIVTSLGMIV